MSARTLWQPSHRTDSRWRRDVSSVGLSDRNSETSASTACRDRMSVDSRAKSAEEFLYALYRRQARLVSWMMSPILTGDDILGCGWRKGGNCFGD